MPRPPSTARRPQLLAAVVDHLQFHGLADCSLEHIARATGTSKRMLLYYFGDRATLIAEAMAWARPDATALFEGVRDRVGLRSATEDLWTAISRGAQRDSVRLLLQTLALATTQREEYGTFATAAVAALVDPLTTAFERAGWEPANASAGATLVVSGLRGLCLDLLVTGDEERVEGAVRLLLDAATSIPGNVTATRGEPT